MFANVLVETKGMSKGEWLRYRKQGIGGSDVSCLLGINKWKSEIELWMDKTNQTNEVQEENEAMQWGHIMEPVIRNHFAELTGKPVVQIEAILQHPEYPFMLADVDGVTVDENNEPAILEIKTASEFRRSDWDDGVPTYYETQVQHYLCVTGMRKAYVAVLFGGNSFRIYEIDADEELHAMLIAVEKEFWNKVQNMIRPSMDASDAAKKLLDSIYRGGIAEEIVLPTEAIEYVDLYIEACAEEESAKAKKQDASNHLKELMGDFDKARCMDRIISWKAVSQERLDTKLLKEQEPEIYSKYLKTTSSRRFTLK